MATRTTSERDIAALVDARHQEIRRNAVADAIAVAAVGNPLPHIRACLSGLEVSYDTLARLVDNRIGAASAERRKAHSEGIAQEKIDGLKGEALGTAAEIRRMADERGRLSPVAYRWKSLWWRMILVAVFVVGDFVFNSYGLTAFGGPLLGGVLFAVVIAVALLVVSMYVGRKYVLLEGGERGRFVLRWTLRMSIVLLALSALRGFGLMHFGWNPSAAAVMGFLFFFVTNMLVFFAAAAFGTTLPTPDDHRIRRAHGELDRRMHVAQSRLNRLASETSAIRERMNAERADFMDLCDRRDYFANLIAGYRNETLLAFRREVTSRNQDAFGPDNFLTQ